MHFNFFKIVIEYNFSISFYNKHFYPVLDYFCCIKTLSN